MTEKYLESMGFQPTDIRDNLIQVDHTMVQGLMNRGGFDHIAIYSDPSGVNLTLVKTSNGFSVEIPTVRGVGGYRVEVFQVMPGTAQVDILNDDGKTEFRVLAFVDDPLMYPWAQQVKEQGIFKLLVDETIKYRGYYLGAIAIDLNVYDSVEEWRDAQTPIVPEGQITKSGLKGPVYMGPKFVSSPWLFELYGGNVEATHVNPSALFKAICKKVDVVTNELTGKKWYRVLADCGFDVILAMPIDASPIPKTGSVVDGRAFITASTGFWCQDQPMAEQIIGI